MFIGIGTWVHFPGSALECKNIGLDLFMSRPLCLYAVTLITSGCVLFFLYLTPFVIGWIPWMVVSVDWSFYFVYPASMAENSYTFQIFLLLIVYIPLLSVTWRSFPADQGPVGKDKPFSTHSHLNYFWWDLNFFKQVPQDWQLAWHAAVSQQWPGKMCCRW